MSIQSVILIVLFVGRCVSSQTEITGCKVAVVGAGWGGIYFAYRLVDSGAVNASDICIFEASPTRIGGRVYSVSIGDGLVVDCGAYRIENTQNLVLSLVQTKLKLPTRNYDPDDPNYHIICDKNGLNAGYVTGMKTMLAQLFAAGLRPIYMGYRLSKIVDGTLPGSKLTFTNGAYVNADKCFLNIPKTALEALDLTSNVRSLIEVPVLNQVALSLPQEYPAAKYYLYYRNAWWVTILGLTAGTFSNLPFIPPISGRYFDGPVNCTNSTGQYSITAMSNSTFNANCSGALLVFYNNTPTSSYYSQYHTPGEPLTILKQDNFTHAKLLNDTHKALMDMHESMFKAKNVDPQSIALPELGLLGYWHSIPGQSQYPSWSIASSTLTPDLVVKPCPKSDICICNEAWSGSDGWAAGSIIMTEKCLYRYYGLSKPSWADDTYYTTNVVNTLIPVGANTTAH